MLFRSRLAFGHGTDARHGGRADGGGGITDGVLPSVRPLGERFPCEETDAGGVENTLLVPRRTDTAGAVFRPYATDIRLAGHFFPAGGVGIRIGGVAVGAVGAWGT